MDISACSGWYAQRTDSEGPRLGLRQNLGQFVLLVVVNGFVGGMVGLERSILPAIAEHEFHLAARAAVLSFIVVFGIVKAFTNYAAGRFADQAGRKAVLVRTEIRQGASVRAKVGSLSQLEIFKRTSLTDRDLSSVSQAGLVNNLNDGMAWGLFPLLYAAAGLSLSQIGWLAALYPAVWGAGQLLTGALSDRTGRKWLIASGMWVQAAGIVTVAFSRIFWGFAAGSLLLGAGTAMVYPTLLAAIGDVAHPAWRAGAVGVYRLWRDLGYAAGALLAGITADALGIEPAIGLIAALTFGSGVVVAVRMRETKRAQLEPVALSSSRKAIPDIVVRELKGKSDESPRNFE